MCNIVLMLYKRISVFDYSNESSIRVVFQLHYSTLKKIIIDYTEMIRFSYIDCLLGFEGMGILIGFFIPVFVVLRNVCFESYQLPLDNSLQLTAKELRYMYY